MKPIAPSILAGLALALALVSPPPAAGSTESLSVIRLEARLGRHASLRLEGDLTGAAMLAGLDPLTDPVEISVGAVPLLQGPPWPERTVVRDDEGGLRIDARRPYAGRGRAKLRLYRGSGWFTLVARGFDATALREAGPAGLAVTVSFAGTSFTRVLEPSAHGTRWSYRTGVAPGGHSGGGGGGGASYGDPLAPGTFETLATGVSSPIATRRFEVVRDDAAWQSLWSENGGTGSAPAVDFSRDMVVALWLGARPTSGYAVRIDAVQESQILGMPGAPAGVRVHATEFMVPPGTPVTAVPSQPYHIVRAPRTDPQGGSMLEPLSFSYQIP